VKTLLVFKGKNLRIMMFHHVSTGDDSEEARTARATTPENQHRSHCLSHRDVVQTFPTVIL
jgi:hypothetical protein